MITPLSSACEMEIFDSTIPASDDPYYQDTITKDKAKICDTNHIVIMIKRQEICMEKDEAVQSDTPNFDTVEKRWRPNEAIGLMRLFIGMHLFEELQNLYEPSHMTRLTSQHLARPSENSPTCIRRSNEKYRP